jgi:LEA14-like dessication related protein
MLRRFAVAVACAFALVGCAPKGPEVRVLGVHEARRHEVVFVQVTNPANRSMRLTKLEYTFASQGQAVSTGKIALAREVPAGAAVVVEVPLELSVDGPMTLQGKLTAELDQIVRTFTVSALVSQSN